MELHLRYDDRYHFSSPVTKISDPSVLTLTSASDAVATGIGTCEVTLEQGEICTVTVSAAPLSVLLIIGQSNGEGSTVGENEICDGERVKSVICPEGQVYTTYAWSTLGHARRVAGIDSQTAFTPESAPKFVASSLTSDVSRAGTPLEYSLSAFTAERQGKVGFDSALAFNWNRLTGEKVWVVNCAAGSTAIEAWLPEADRYENCVALMRQVNETLNEEIARGHYTLSKFAAFWLQGESNKADTCEEYTAKFETMYSSMKKDLILSDGHGLDGMGIVSVRSFLHTNDEQDLCDNGPRQAQRNAVCAKEGLFADVFRACAVNDLWVTDFAVADYWDAVYPNSVYPFQTHEPYENPKTIAQVHNSIHYFQPGYNEIGMTSARAALANLK